MSMICFGKSQKQEYLSTLMPLLWEGKVEQAVMILREEITPRNTTKH